YDTTVFPHIIRRPTSSTLFPYTTLFRSHDEPPRESRAGAEAGLGVDWQGIGALQPQRALLQPHPVPARTAEDPRSPGRSSAAGRSEEHTSELQSRFDLVCRLLLEKKKNK